MTINKIHARNRAQSIARGPIPFMSLLAGGATVIGLALGAGLSQPASAAPVDLNLELAGASVPAEPAPVVSVPESLAEDDPMWDCRINGNTLCGVEVEGTWYLIDFEGGLPVSVTERGF